MSSFHLDKLKFPPPPMPEGLDDLRTEVRNFLSASYADDPWARNSDFGVGFSPKFSKELGEKGWIGMTWPKKYGGHGRSMLERYVVTEELLAAGAPVFAHWIADRQSGPLLLRFGSQELRKKLLPLIVSGQCYFSIGMSEADSGSDLASIRTKATRNNNGWRLNGSKIWTSNAHRNHYMIALCRTNNKEEGRHKGLSQFLIDLKNDNLVINPIINMLGEHEFNEVVFEDTDIDAYRLIGNEGDGWKQVTSELAYERSGPERFLSSFHIFASLVNEIGEHPDMYQKEAIGRLTSRLWTLRQMSVAVAGMLDAGESPEVEAAIVKNLGNNFEQEVVSVARSVMPVQSSEYISSKGVTFSDLMAEATLRVPSFTLRGGTTEIMKSIIARGLGLR